MGEYPTDFPAQVLKRRFQNRAPGIKDDGVATGDPVKLALNRRPHAPLQAIPDDSFAQRSRNGKPESRRGSGIICYWDVKRGEIAAGHAHTALVNGAELRRATDPL
ncbi:MAG TPA: hypothetical protein VH302_01845 [Bryobacteraceae bacterium]|nr:hypothetical protein [Bryobacteraceae bacterium]